MTRLTDEFKDQNNKFYLSTYGAILALGFSGEQGFIDRSYNMCSNHGITKPHQEPKLLENHFSYCLTTKDNLAKGLKNYFINEIKYFKDVPLVQDKYVEIPNGTDEPDLEYIVEYNEEEIEKLAEIKTLDFLENYITPKTFMVTEENNTDNSFYEVSFEKKGNEEESGLDLVTNLTVRE